MTVLTPQVTQTDTRGGAAPDGSGVSWFLNREDKIKSIQCDSTAGGFTVRTYEDENGIWQHLPYDRYNDAAVVFYRINEIRNSIDLVMGGFTADATGYLAEYLRTTEKSAFWPPTYSDINQQIGIFMIRFTGRSNGVLDTEVIPVGEQAIEKRVIKIRDAAQGPRVTS